MASISVTTYTLKLIDEAERQAKVGSKPSNFKCFRAEINTRFTETGKVVARPPWETSKL